MKTENEKTLIILTPGFPIDESDSTCLPAQQAFLLALNRNYPSINIKVITFHYPYRSNKFLWNGIQVISLNGRNKKGFARLMIWMRAWRAIGEFKKNAQLMGILSFWCTECGLVGKWFASYHKLKHHCWILGQDAKKQNGFVKFIRPTPTELIALSPFLQHEFEANHSIRPFTVIPNAIDPGDFSPPAVARTIDVIGVGSLISLKQYDVFIAVLRRVTERFPNLKAILCGKGPEENSLQTLISEYGLWKNIRMVGEKSHAHVLDLMQQSKILLHPSRYEGYSSVCLEALYAGAHVVSFRAPAATPIEHWHVVESIEEMEQKILEIMSGPTVDHKRVLVHTVEESARAVVDLFSEKNNTGSQ